MNVWRLGFAVLTVGFIPLFFANTMPVAVAIMCVMGMGVAGCLVTIDCIGAKIIDDDYSRHGVKREGMLTSLVGVMNRLNGLYVSLGYKLSAWRSASRAERTPARIPIWRRGSCSACFHS